MYNCHQNQSTFLKKYMYRSKWSINPDANLTCILKGKCLVRLIFFFVASKGYKTNGSSRKEIFCVVS